MRVVRAYHHTGTVEVDEFSKTVGQILLDVPTPGGVNSPDSDLPPEDSVNRPQGSIHAEFIGPDISIALVDILRQTLSYPPISQRPSGSNVTSLAQSSMFGTAVVTSTGLGLDHEPLPLQLTGPVSTIAFGKAGTLSLENLSSLVKSELAKN